MEPSLIAANPHSIAILITYIYSIAYLAKRRTIFYSCRLCCISWCPFCCTSCWPLLYITFAFLGFIGLLLPTLFIFPLYFDLQCHFPCLLILLLLLSQLRHMFLACNDTGLRHQFPPRSLIPDRCCEIRHSVTRGFSPRKVSHVAHTPVTCAGFSSVVQWGVVSVDEVEGSVFSFGLSFPAGLSDPEVTLWLFVSWDLSIASGLYGEIPVFLKKGTRLFPYHFCPNFNCP